MRKLKFLGLLAMALALGVTFIGCGDGGDSPGPLGGATQYTVTYSTGDGTGTAPASQTVVAGTVITLPGQEGMTAPSGQIFDTWLANDGTSCSAGSSYTVNADVTFTAQWKNSNGEEGEEGDDNLESDIDTALLGTWRDTLGGGTLTITFESNGTVTWGGSAGSPLNDATSAYQGAGWQCVWIATGGQISYKYSGPDVPVTTVPVYGYSINGSGQLELTSGGMVFLTLIKGTTEGGEDSGTLAISGLPDSGTYAVYVFSEGTDISTYDAVIGAYTAQNWQAVGATVSGGGSFTLYGWNGSAQVGIFTGTGNYPVLLLNASGSMTETSNPMYSWATVSFSDGTGTAAIGDFTALVLLLPLTGAVSIDGLPHVGETLTANVTALGGSGTISYQWSRGTSEISGANDNTYTLVDADEDYTISVRVTQAGYSGSVTSTPTAAVIYTLKGRLDAAKTGGTAAIINFDDEIAFAPYVFDNRSVNGNDYFYGKTITLQGQGPGKNTITLSGNGSLFVINSGVTLILEDVILKGHSSNDTYLVYVTGTLEMRGTAQITGNNGGGVWVGGDDASAFIMHDNAAVSDNTSSSSGGGVFVFSGTFTMNDSAVVSGNTASTKGGGVYVMDSYGTTFIMNDSAVVSGNTANVEGGGVMCYGTFLMKGGTVYGNNVDASLANNAPSGASLFVNTYVGTAEYGNGTTIPSPYDYTLTGHN